MGDYTQLWSYFLYPPGNYKIRLVYDYAFHEDGLKLIKTMGIKPDPWQVTVKTRFIRFRVLP